MLSGRFAPSPTGPLHMGSLTMALASYLDITSTGGTWHLRLDDIDPPREASHAREHILQSLAAHGLTSASPVRFQSSGQQRFTHALNELRSDTYYCSCTRSQLKGQPIYPGTCRQKNLSSQDTALRLKLGDLPSIEISDGVFPTAKVYPAHDVGDLVILRRDGLWAYNFATAIDDGHDFTHIFRGADLYHTTAAQVLVMNRLGLDVPSYTHMPLLCFENGDKLSKQTHAPALDALQATNNLKAAFHYLGMNPDSRAQRSVQEWLGWGLNAWPSHQLPEELPIYQAKPFLT
ncbi:MAG: glutamyl-Q tRNA(Asp) synthetase [Candidatus Azotimanducaceae bacterium]|jgi:glutamyl-Q tRNA(Asp) synthetase